MAFYTPHFNEILTAKIDRIWEKVISTLGHKSDCLRAFLGFRYI